MTDKKESNNTELKDFFPIGNYLQPFPSLEGPMPPEGKMHKNIDALEQLISIAGLDGKIDIEQMLIDAGVNLDDKALCSSTSLTIKACWGYVDIERMFINVRACVNHETAEGKEVLRISNEFLNIKRERNED